MIWKGIFLLFYSLLSLNLLDYVFLRCEKFRADRTLSINRFTVEDTRNPEEIEEEEKVLVRLKQAFKIAKKAAEKKKEL